MKRAFNGCTDVAKSGLTRSGLIKFYWLSQYIFLKKSFENDIILDNFANSSD